MIKGIIFDLDQTLVDSSIAERHRKNRDWQNVYGLIPSFRLYDGMERVFAFIRQNDIKSCIVTTSPGVYASKVVKHFNIPCDFVIDYFSTTNKKPHPEAMLLALEKLCLSNEEVISFGDRDVDIIASKLAQIRNVACVWGTSDFQKLVDAEPSTIIYEPTGIIELFEK